MGCKPVEKPKQKLKKGLWSPDEDRRLRNYILNNGHGCWSSVPINAGRTDNEIKNYWHSYLKNKVAKMDQTQPQNKTEYPNPYTGPAEAALSSQNSTAETFERHEGSSAAINDHQPTPRLLHLPKLIFAEWLSVDQFHGQDLGSSGEPAVSEDLSGRNPNLQDPFLNGFLRECPFGGEFQEDQPSQGSADETFLPEFKSAEDWLPESGFVNFFTEDDDMWRHFNI
ncbi:hypothetical protein U1Q18_004519 [Sarracenia purpurea var. burkii]